MTNNTTKRGKIFSITAFSIAVVFVVLLCCNFTLAYFGGSASASGNIVLAKIDVGVDYSLAFDDVVLPNQYYTGTSKYKLNISNSGNSGDIYVRVVMESNLEGHIEPLVANPALWSNSGTNSNEYYYLGTINSGSTVSFLNGFKTANNFNNDIAGKGVEIKFVVHAIQAQYNAVINDLSWIVGAPTEFKTLVGYTG